MGKCFDTTLESWLKYAATIPPAQSELPEIKAAFFAGAQTALDMGRAEARALYKVLGACDLCGAQATERHHVDHNTHNNERSNIMMLCNPCHHRQHVTRRRKPLPPKHCRICGRLIVHAVHGRCGRCQHYHRRNGSERPLIDGRIPSRTIPSHCIRGHEFTEENTAHRIRNGRSGKLCKACMTIRAAEWNAARRKASAH